MSHPISPRILAELGLEGAAPTLLETWRAPEHLAQTDAGFVRQPSEVEPLTETLQADWDPEEIPLEALAPAWLAVWRRNVQVLLLDPGPAEVFATRTLEPLRDGVYYLELSPGVPEGLLLELEGRRCLVEAQPGEVRVFELPGPTSVAPEIDAGPAPKLDPPDLDALLGPEQLDASLRSQAEVWAATREPYSVCAAVGWVSGLWRPTRRESLEALLEVEWPQARSTRWLDGVDAAALETIVAAALGEADRLVLALDDLPSLVAEQSPDARSAALSWLRDRQTLAEVRRVLGDHGARLDSALSNLDDATRASAEVFFALEDLLDDDALRLAAGRDPGAPWLRVAGS